MEQTTPTPLDQVEALLAQQRLAQEQLGQALKAARTEQQSGYLSSGAGLPSLQWSSAVIVATALLMCAAITAVVVAKVVRPKLQRLREQRAVERARQEEMFVQFSLHGDVTDDTRAAADNQKTDFRMKRRSTALENFSAAGSLAATEATYMAPETTKVADDVEIDFDLDLSSYDEPPPSVAPTQSEVTAELVPQPQLSLLDVRWQTQLDLAKEFCSMGQLQEAALIYAELVAHGDPEVAHRADALLSALPQSREATTVEGVKPLR